MANLVINWVNKDVKLSRVIEHPEKELANGYLLGELLAKLHLIDDETFKSFKDSLDEDNELQNFAKICKVLKLLKIKFDERQVARIMTEQYGCAASLVVKVRDFVQEAAKDRPAHDAPIKSLISVRPKPWTRKPVLKADEMDYMDRLIEEIGFEDRKSLDMALHLKRFEDLRLAIEAGIEAKELQQAQSANAAKHQSRELERVKFGMKSAYLKDWLARGHKDWAKNMRTKRSNFTRLLQYEMCLAESRQIRTENSRTIHRAQAKKGIEWFETNMLRLGVGEGEKRSMGKQQATKEDPLAFLRRIRATEEAQQAVLRLQVSDLMLELREKAQARRKATREKEIRRRKDQCDQNNVQADMEEAGAETKYMDNLINKMEAEGELWHATWTEGAEEELKEEDDLHEAGRTLVKQYRAQEEAVADFFTSLADKCVLEEARRRDFNQRLPLILQARQDAKHSRAVALVSDVVAQMLDLAIAASQARKAEGVALAPSEWQRLKDLFVNGHDFFPPKTADPNVEEDEEEQRRRNTRRGKKTDPAVEASVNAEAVVWHADMQRGAGAWAPRALPAMFGDGPTAPPPERELLTTIDALLAPDKPSTNAPSTEPPSPDTPAVLVAVVGAHPDLASICQLAQSFHAPPLTLVALDEAVAVAQRYGAATISDDDKQAVAASPSLQLLAELGTKHLAYTTDPKNPAPPSDLLLAELVVAYARYLSPSGSWLLAGFPTTPLQAKLLEKTLSGYSDPEVVEYLAILAKAEKKRFGAPKEPPKKPKDTGKDAAALRDGPLSGSGNGRASATQPPAAGAAFGGDPNASAFDAVIVLSSPPPPSEEAEGAAPIVVPPSVVGLWSTFAAPPPRCLELKVGPSETPAFIAESLDLLLEATEQRKAKARQMEGQAAETPAVEGETPTVEGEGGEEDWRVVLERKRGERAARLSLAARMWRAHVNGGRQLCVEEMEPRLKAPWEEARRAYDKEMHRGLSFLTNSLRPLHTLESDSRAQIRWMINAPLPQLASACQSFANRLGHSDKDPRLQTTEGLRRFASDVEVSLGALVEERYEEICETAVHERGIAEAAASSAFTEAERALRLLISAEARRLAARLRLLADFDDASNVSDRQEMSQASLDAVAAVKASTQTLLASLTKTGMEWPTLTSALQTAINGVDAALSQATEGPRSALAIAGMCESATRCLTLLDGLHHFFLTFGETVAGFSTSLYSVLKSEIRRRTEAHHDAVARALRPIIAELTDTSDRAQLRVSLEGLAKSGIEVDESRRVPSAVGPTLLDSGLSYLPPETISALVYALRSRASRGPLLKRDAFVKCVTETMRKADGQRHAWTDAQRVGRVADALDPMNTGMVAWRRFAHSLLLGLLPRPPTLSALLTTRLAAQRRADPKPRNSALPSVVNPSERRPSVGAAGRRPSLKAGAAPARRASSLQAVIRVSTGEFLDLPMWFDGQLDRKQARSMRELYALVFAEDDGRVALSQMLLTVCESIVPEGSVLGPSLVSHCCLPLLCAAMLLSRPFRAQDHIEAEELVKAFAMRVASSGTGDVRCGALPGKVLESLLQHGTHLHTPELAAAFVRRVAESLGLSAAEGQDVMLPLDRLLGCELLCELVQQERLFAVCPVYALVEQEVPETGDV